MCNTLSDLKRNVVIDTDYKYDLYEFSVPAKYKTEFNKDLFGNIYSETTRINDGYTGAGIKGVYVSARFTNNCSNPIKFQYEIKAEEKKKLTNTFNMAVGGLFALALHEASPELANEYVKSKNFQEQFGYIKQKIFDMEIGGGGTEYKVGKIPVMVDLVKAPEVTITSMLNENYGNNITTETNKGGSTNQDYLYERQPSLDPGFVASYVARLSSKDHINSSGAKLQTAADVIRQDRANYHKYGIRNTEDISDNIFDEAGSRANISNMLKHGHTTTSALQTIINGTPLVRVLVYRDYIDVSIVEN
jgi:hypothetical protein